MIRIGSTQGLEVVIEYYDRPLTTIAIVNPDADESRRMIELKTSLHVVPIVDDQGNLRIRLRREQIQQMLDLVDGRVVTDFFDDLKCEPLRVEAT